jgi:purine-nucleoside phosphorylase
VNYDDIKKAADKVATLTGGKRHRIAVVLGSGLSDYAAKDDATGIAYDSIPGFPVPRVEGHSGTVVSVHVGGEPVLLLAGRVHFYEGWSMDEVVFGVRTAVSLGAEVILLTNAAGSVNTTIRPGALVTISDHLNLAGANPLAGDNDERLGPRFPNLSNLYDERLRQVTRVAGGDVDTNVEEGVYAWFSGPSYETPAEVAMARTLGADLVGMSTVPEAIAARHMGARVVAISLVTNLAAGLSDDPPSHEEVQETAAAAAGRFAALLDVLLPRLGEELQDPA